MWSAVPLLGLIGVVLALLFRLVERWVLHWYHGQRAATRKAVEAQGIRETSVLEVRAVRKVCDGHGRQVEALREITFSGA